MSLMVWGTSSNAGKTIMCSVICRHLFRNGVDVVPFKGSNLSSASFVTVSGEELGMGQALQAWACEIEPYSDMNPVLLKPHNGHLHYVLNGHPYDVSNSVPSRSDLLAHACGAYDRLSDAHDVVICEGSGAPSEINLMEGDVANVGMVRERGMNVILVCDIERGGMFAALYGTWLLVPDNIRPLVKGFVINRFRGDDSILEPGIRRIENLTGMKCLGIMPYVRDISLPEEDSFVGEAPDSDDLMAMRDSYVGSLDELTDIAESSMDMDLLRSFI